MTDVRSETGDTQRSLAGLAERLCNWDRWRPDDGLGALNLVDEGKRLEASAAIRSGTAVSLGFELQAELPQPHGSGRLNPQHVMTELPTAAAFEAADFLMDYLKTRAPFWKQIEKADGKIWVEAKATDDEAAGRWAARGKHQAAE